MKTIEHISFSGRILIPAKSRFQGTLPHSYYIGDVNGSNGEVSSNINVILFNCEEVKEITSFVDLEIVDLEDSISQHPEEKEKLNQQKEFFLKLKKEIEDPMLTLHKPSEDLISHISIVGKFSELKAENVIFISGVSSLVEV